MSEKSTVEMMKELQEGKTPLQAMSKKAMLEENIRTSRKWADALYRGQFSGKDTSAIANLAGFLEDQHLKSVAEYEAESMKHPEWGRPKDLEPKKEAVGAA